MSWFLLIFRNIWFHRKPYLAVLAGVMISTAVVTGALIVGDSVRFSLQRLAEIRLGKIRTVLQTNNRVFRQALAEELSVQTRIQVAPALTAGGIAINSDQNLRINQVQIIGIDDSFRKFWEDSPTLPGTDEAIISRNVAEKLNLKQGDDLLLRIQRIGKAPSDAPFVSEKSPSVSLRVKISAIADDDQMGRFSLKSNQTAPFNIFLPLKQLAAILELEGSANLLVAAAAGNTGSFTSLPDSALSSNLKPFDAALQIRQLPAGNIYQITTDRIFFDDSIAHAIKSAIPGCQSILTYLVNSISCNIRSTPYSFVTAASESFLKQPLGPRQIIINDWLAKDLGVKPGDSLTLRYFLMGPLRSLREDSTRFMVKSVVALKNGLADGGLMPDFPGMSEAGNCRDWETGAPVDLKKIRDKDEQYWKDYRGMPKAFISIDAGQKIWGNRFGNYTAFRFAAHAGDLTRIEQSLMLKIKPAQCGLFFRPVYAEGQSAARNSTDFGELFLSLSFFILLSALLLTAMLFHLMAQMRMAETGVLSAIGFRKIQISGILAGEAFIVATAGAILGAMAGVLYNWGLILGLNTIWQDAVNTSLLVMNVRTSTLFTGAAAGIVTSFAVLFAVVLTNMRKPLSVLVKGPDEMRFAESMKTTRVVNILIAVICTGVSVTLLAWLIINGKALNNPLSLLAGGLMIPGGLALLNLFLIRRSRTPGHSIAGLSQLTLKNLALHRSRTISAVALLALGTFTITITGVNKKMLYGTEMSRHSGTGGFLLWAETLLPVMNDLNTAEGARIFGFHDEEVLKHVRFIQLPRIDGDDASCLNLNQVSQPGLLGVPAGLFNRLNVFTFSGLDPSIDMVHPWKALSINTSTNVIPGYADQTVITWGLRKSIGDTLFYRDESGGILRIKLAGGLDNSIFQGNILVSDSLLRMFYPSAGGSRIMLIDGPSTQQDTIAQRIETLFRDYGLMATPTSVKLASFNAVENTYLTVFMLLGGLGVLIGTVGLGIALLRNLSQRRNELALYLALGFNRSWVFKLILAEHTFMLASGLTLGLISALPVTLPLLLFPVYQVPWMFISAILMLIFINGFLWIYFPARRTLAKNPVAGLRDE